MTLFEFISRTNSIFQILRAINRQTFAKVIWMLHFVVFLLIFPNMSYVTMNICYQLECFKALTVSFSWITWQASFSHLQTIILSTLCVYSVFVILPEFFTITHRISESDIEVDIIACIIDLCSIVYYFKLIV